MINSCGIKKPSWIEGTEGSSACKQTKYIRVGHYHVKPSTFSLNIWVELWTIWPWSYNLSRDHIVGHFNQQKGTWHTSSSDFHYIWKLSTFFQSTRDAGNCFLLALIPYLDHPFLPYQPYELFRAQPQDTLWILRDGVSCSRFIVLSQTPLEIPDQQRIMATDRTVVASGADYETTARRRNVPTQAADGLVVDKVEIDNKKEQVKQVSVCWMQRSPLGRHWPMLTCVSPGRTDVSWIPRRVGVHHRTFNFHDTCLLHATLQDRTLPYCYMGWSPVSMMVVDFKARDWWSMQFWKVRFPLS